MPITTNPLSPHVGLEILGADLSKPFSDADAEAIRNAWIASGLLLVRNVTNAEAHIRISQLLGELEVAATKHFNLKDNPYLLALKVNPEDFDTSAIYEIGGEERVGFIPWHWDQTFMPNIVRGAGLRMVEPAGRGGETGFIDAINAYSRLPDALKTRIDKLEVAYRFTTHSDLLARHGLGFPKGAKILQAPPNAAVEQYLKFPPTVHPMVITQEETGRKVLKYSPHHSLYVLGLSQEDSDALLREIASYLTDETYAYSHQWEKDDLILWDNFRIIHSARGVPRGHSRHAQRTTILGTYDHGRYLDPALDKHKKVLSYVD